MTEEFGIPEAAGESTSPAEQLPEPIAAEKDHAFPSLVLARIQDSRPRYLDGGRAVLRPSLPYDDTARLASCFLDLYIGASYAPDPSMPGCLCRATVLSGMVNLTAEGQEFHLLEAYDMTLEATVTKLMWILGQTTNPEEIRNRFYQTVNRDILYTAKW